MRTLTVALLSLAALVGAGCQDPYAGDRSDGALTSDVRERLVEPTAAGAPDEVARSFAMLWANWDWRSVASRQAELGQMAVGDLERQLRANARSARVDATLKRDKPGSRGTVAAVDLSVHGAQAGGILVTNEQTYTSGRADLGGKRYRVYRVRLTRTGSGWRVSAWQPQP